MLVKTRSLEAHFGTRRTGHLAPVGVRLMRNTVWQGRWQLPQVGVHSRPKNGVLIRAAWTLDDQVDLDGQLGEEPESVAEQAETHLSFPSFFRVE